jgi:hypothetical protein
LRLGAARSDPGARRDLIAGINNDLLSLCQIGLDCRNATGTAQELDRPGLCASVADDVDISGVVKHRIVIEFARERVQSSGNGCENAPNIDPKALSALISLGKLRMR